MESPDQCLDVCKRYRRRGAVLEIPIWTPTGFGRRVKKLIHRMHDWHDRTLILKVIRREPGLTSPEIARRLPLVMGGDQVDWLLNQPLADGSVIGWNRRRCTVTGQQRMTYWHQHHIFSDRQE